MKSGFITVILALLILTTVGTALPSLMGYRGINRIVDARPMGANEIDFGVFAKYWASTNEWSNITFWNFHTHNDTTINIKDKEQLAVGFLSVGYGVTDWLDIAARMSYVVPMYQRGDETTTARNRSGEWEDLDGMGDISLGLKLGFSPTPSNHLLWLGIQNWFSFAPSSNKVMYSEDTDGLWVYDEKMWDVRRPMLSTGHTSYGVGGLITLDLQDVWDDAPLRFHFNGNYEHFKQTFDFWDFRFTYDSTGTSPASAVHYYDSSFVEITLEENVLGLGGGIEFPTRFATLFVEYYDWHFLDREGTNDVAYLTPGIRFTTNTGMLMDVSFDIGLTDFEAGYFDLGHDIYNSTGSVTEGQRIARAPYPMGGTQDWGVGVTFAFSSELIKEPAPREGTISGMITDVSTGGSIGTTITFPGMPIPNVTSDPATGFYTVTVMPGTIPISVSSPVYNTASATIVLESRQDVVMDFQLERNAGIVTGVVIDLETGEPIQATIEINTEETATTECSAEGIYQFEVGAGTYTISASHPDYLGKSLPVVVTADETSVVNFELREALQEGQVMSFDNIYFDVASANLKPESYGILDGVVSLLNENPNAVIQIGGHTDSDGSTSYNQTLSEQRAASVFSYLVSHGVSASRLTSFGFGEGMPIVPNNSAANKARNRRIEFTVLSN